MGEPAAGAAATLLAFLLLTLLAACGEAGRVPPVTGTQTDAHPTPAAPPASVITGTATSSVTDSPVQAGTSASTIEPGRAGSDSEDKNAGHDGGASEVPVIEIALSGPAALAVAEFSGMAWYGEWLFLLPQYPDYFTAASDGYLFAIHKETINAYLEGGAVEAMEPRLVPFSAEGIRSRIEGYEGYEAILFDGNRVYLTIEAAAGGTMFAYLLAGQIAPDLSSVVMNPDSLTPVQDRVQISNKSFESLLLIEDDIVVVHEVNGRGVAEEAIAYRYDRDLQHIGVMTVPDIAYRLTDATAAGDDGRFWALNIFFPGDRELFVEREPLAEKWGQGETHQNNMHVERIVAFTYTEGQIRLAGEAPVQLRLLPLISRNWEGVARLDDRGFLIVTDKFPSTMLAFVPTSGEG